MTSFKTTKVANDLLRQSYHMEVAKAIYNSNKSPLCFIIKSAGSVRLVPIACERCGKKFRFYRKEHTIFDKTEHEFHHWKHVCIDCINLETDSY